MEFEQGDARTFRAAEPFDAIVTRLLLFHLPDAVELPPCVAGAWAVGPEDARAADAAAP